MTAVCSFCDEPVDPLSRFTWRAVHGWERKALDPTRRSGSDIALREPREEWAHDQCVRRAQSGVAPLQESLL